MSIGSRKTNEVGMCAECDNPRASEECRKLCYRRVNELPSADAVPPPSEWCDGSGKGGAE